MILLDLLVPLAILPDNVLVTLDTQEPHVINVSISFAFSFLILTLLLYPDLAGWIDEKIVCGIEMQNVLLNFQLSTVMTNQCPTGWTYINKKCYQIVTAKKSWTAARDFCTSLNAKLAEPQTTCESDLLHYHLQLTIAQLSTAATTDYEVEVWIGIQDISSEGNFVYNSNGNGISVEYWASGEPNNDAGDEDCAHLYGAFVDGRWNDNDCAESHWSFCEKTL